MEEKPPANQEARGMGVRSPGQEDPQEKEMAPYAGILAGNRWVEDSGKLQFLGSRSQAELRTQGPPCAPMTGARPPAEARPCPGRGPRFAHS